MFPSPLPEDRFAQNGDIPSTSALRRVARAYNFVSTHQRKLVFAKAYHTQSTPVGALASVRNNHFIFRTGENVDSVAVMVGLAPADVAGAEYARATLELLDGTNTLTGRAMTTSSVDTLVTYTPTQVAWQWSELTVAGDTLLPDTVYRGSLVLTNYCRPHSLMVYEKAKTVAASSNDGATDALKWEAGRPLYDADAQSLAETGTLLWRHNAAHLLSWSQKSQATPITFSATTWTNLLDGTTAWSATSAGYSIATQYHDTQKKSVRVQLAIYAERVSGTGTLDVRLMETGGQLLGRSGITTAQASATPGAVFSHLITAKAATKADLQLQCSATATWNIYAINLWEYEA